MKVSVVDFDAGNLPSVQRALRHCGADVTLAETPGDVLAADRPVLPGVGAFASCVAALHKRQLFESVCGYAERVRPFLGICVGMQMMFDASDEFGDHAGLGIIPGRVRRIPSTTHEGGLLKVPHVGWSPLIEPRAGAWSGGILSNTPYRAEVYFVHSYHGEPLNAEHRLADCDHGGHSILAAVRKEHLFGCQFHPEKSGNVGLQIIRDFLTL